MDDCQQDEETLIPMREVPRMVRRGGRPLHYEAVKRWRIVGVRGNKLSTRWIDGRPYTTTTELTRFLKAIENGPIPQQNGTNRK